MTTNEMAHVIATAVQFIGVVLGGVFAVELCAMWLRNRREERMNSVRTAEARSSERFDGERNSWLQILAEKDREIETLKAVNERLTKNYEIATRILAVAERKEA